MKQPELIIEDLIPQGRPVGATTKELRALADDIHTNGLKHPILVMDGIVVDGLKRIAAFKLLGRARIPALVTTNFGEACFHLEKTREGQQLLVLRVIELVEAMEPFRQRYHKLRYSPKLHEENLAKPWGGLVSRTLVARAVGMSDSYAEALMQLLKVARSDPEIARRIALIKRGEDTVHGAYQAKRRRHNNHIITNAKPAEIRTTTTNGLQTMETTIAAMAKFGSMLTLPREERITLISAINEVKRELYMVAKGIREGLNMEAKEGQEG